MKKLGDEKFLQDLKGEGGEDFRTPVPTNSPDPHSVSWMWEQMSDEQRRGEAIWLESIGIGKKYHPWFGQRIRLKPQDMKLLHGWCSDAHNAIHKAGTGFLILGTFGTGKTTLLRIMAGGAYRFSKAQMRYREGEHGTVAYQVPGISVRYVHAVELFQQLDLFEPGMERYISPDLLLIDDWGTNIQTNRSNANFDFIIEQRYMRGKSTGVSSNISVESLKKNHPRATDRMLDKSWMERLHVMGGSQRY